MNPTFTHLHIHTEYSLVDGAIRISDAIAKAKDAGHRALAITDHANMYGAIDFYTKAKDAGINPILGSEIYHEGSSPGLEGPFHLVLLARNKRGYHNLMRCVSKGYLVGKGDVSVCPEEFLDQTSEDLIALSACLLGEFGQLVTKLVSLTNEPVADLSQPPNEQIADLANAFIAHKKRMQARYGCDGYYVELIDNNLPYQKELLPHLVEVAKWLEIPIVASADAHYLNEDDQDAHNVLVGIKNDLTLQKMRDRRKNVRFHMLSNDEFVDVFGKWPEAITNTNLIAEKCQLELSFGEYFLPKFKLEGEETAEDALRRLSFAGLEGRFADYPDVHKTPLTDEIRETYTQRLEMELGVINSMGFPGYFLIVQDFINWAKNNNIPVGPGRGSGAGSLVAYALRITDLDPIPYGLIFERFLNPDRVSMPDFDVDFCQERRDEVIQYVGQTYGKHNVAQITTFGKMKAKAAIRDVGRVLGLSYTRVDKIAKLIPNELDIKLKDALSQEPRLVEEMRSDPLVKDMVELALKIEGLCRHTSVHAAGVVISEGGMENYVPVYKNEDGSLITQYEMKNAEKVGLVKFDFLGLKTLTVIQAAVELVRAKKDPKFDIAKIPMDDGKVYSQVSDAHTVGVFQLESSGMQKILVKLRPNRFEDIIAMVALFRPGPLGSGMVDDFIERKHGRQDITYVLPQLEPILKETYGIILYQEQVQKIAATLANYSLGEADLLRRAMGKKKPEEMAKQKTRFVSGCLQNDIKEETATEIFDLMAMFAAYGFNKSHSAAYGLVSYQTAYLKAHFPEEYMAAIMTCDMDNSDKIVRYIEECRRMGFKILPPDINRSQPEFDVASKGQIGFGLAAIKGIGAGSLKPLLDERSLNGPFQTLSELSRRVNLAKVGKKTLELLTQVGALDGFGLSRTQCHRLIPEMVKYSESIHSARTAGQGMLFIDDEADAAAIDDPNWSKYDDMEEDPVATLCAERALLGVFLSGHPTDYFGPDIKRLGRTTMKDLPKAVGKKKLPLVAFLSGVSERLTKTGKRMAYLYLEDHSGAKELVMFEKEFPEEFPPADSMVLASCSISKSFDGSSLSYRVEDIVPLEKARESMIKRMSFSFNLESITSELPPQVAALEDLTRTYPGKVSLKIRVQHNGACMTIRSGEGVGLKLTDELIKQLPKLQALGVEVAYTS